MDPSCSGRVDATKFKGKNRGFVVADADNPMFNIKKIFNYIETMKQHENQLLQKGPSIGEELTYHSMLKQIRKETEKARHDLVKQMKMNFKHINGMPEARINNVFLSEAERYETVKVDKIIEKKIIAPSERVIDCMKGVK